MVAGTAIDATVFNTLMTDIASGLSTCLLKDGTQTPTANIPMGNYKFTGLGLGSSTTDSARMDNAIIQNVCEGRLSVSSTLAVTTSNSTGSTLYLNPYKGNKIALYNGTQWVLRSIAAAGSTSISVPSTTDTNYDVWAYDNSGTVTLELTAWTNATTRATALATQDGVYCKTGTLTRRYLGSIRTGPSSGIVADSAANRRHVWNYYNRVLRHQAITDSSTWAYSTPTFRQANGDTAYQLDVLIGVSEDPIHAWVETSVRNSAAAVVHYVGIGVDSTSSNSAFSPAHISQVANIQTPVRCHYIGYPGVGRHYLPWLEYCASNTANWNDTATGGIFCNLLM